MTKPPPTDAEWQRLGDHGDRIVVRSLGREALSRVKSGEHPAAAMALAFGGLSSCARILASCCGADRADRIERMAVAYLRGAFRSADGPINADGTPYHDGQNG